jgi:hypothetical protein
VVVDFAVPIDGLGNTEFAAAASAALRDVVGHTLIGRVGHGGRVVICHSKMMIRLVTRAGLGGSPFAFGASPYVNIRRPAEW